MQHIHDFARTVNGFYKKTAVEQLLLIAWFIETHRGRSSFDAAYLRQCFKEANIDAPDMSVYLPRLAAKKPPQLRKVREGYCLAAAIRRDFDQKHGSEPSVVAVSQLLLALPIHVPNILERDYLLEALNCYRVKAYRAAIIMAWNLAYDHLVRWIVSDPVRLNEFNLAIPVRYPKSKIVIRNEDDFSDLKESELLEVCRAANLIHKNTAHILKDKLTRRNAVAYPSSIVVTQHQADDAISDLINNVILKLT